MKSRASFKSHPLHPILVAFPISFFTGTFLFDVFAAITGDTSYSLTALYLNIAGLVGGALAAIPGFIDYLFTIPPSSSGKKRGAKHGLINVSVLVIFTVVLLLRQNTAATLWQLLLVELAGLVLLTISGWLGGTLVYRNQIGVDMRYAGAGKWEEIYLGDKTGEVEIPGAAALEAGQMKLLHVQGKRLVLGKTESGFVVFDDHCTHRGGSLAAGALVCDTVQCPWHGSQFNVHTGQVQAGPAKTKIAAYSVTERNGSVFVRL